jgi:outer membrane receptor protein involved in Fe transport
MFDSRFGYKGRAIGHTHARLIIFLTAVPALFLLLMVHPAAAQLLFGSIVGNVTDASGAAVPGATVTVTQLETNETRETKTNDQGGFTLSTIHTGTYNISVAKEGFKGYTADNVLVSVNVTVRFDAALQVGAQNQRVEVTAEAAALQTDRADTHSEFTTQQLIDLPQPTRTFEGIVALTPGVAPPSASSGGNNNPSKSYAISANGTSNKGTNVLIDGVSATFPWVQSNASYAPSAEAIETVNVVTGSSGGDMAMTNGASITVQTKSGTNNLHGEMYGYNISNAMEARSYFLPASQKNPKLIENDTGGTLGGKIIKNKLFYFGSYEGDFIRQGFANSTVTIPTDAIRSGNLSASATPIYDPSTGTYNAAGIPTGRTPFPGNIIPANRINPAAAKLIALLPEPNQASASAIAPSNNYYANQGISNTLQHVDTKIDWNASSKWKITGRYGFMPYNITEPLVFGPILGGNTNNQFQFGHSTAVAVAATYVANPTFVVDTNWGYTFAHMILNPPNADKRLGSDFLGIPGTNLGDLPHAGGLPAFSINNYTGYGYQYSPLQYDDPVFQYVANATKIKGAHNIRFGVNVSQQHMNHFETAPTSFSFNGGATQCGPNCASNPAANAYNSYADFLLGLPQSYANSLEPTPLITLRTWEWSLYAQDQWNVNKKLSVTLGTRWEYYPVPSRVGQGIEAYNFQTNQIELCGQGPNNSTCGITAQKDLFAPRIGIAYRPTEKLVIRAGYSLNPEQQNIFRDGIYTYPIRLDFSANGLSTYDPVGSLTTGIPLQPAPKIVDGAVTLPAGANFNQAALLPQKQQFIRGYTQTDNFTIQNDFGRGWIGSVAYVGSLTIHQHTRYNINYGTLNGGVTSQPFFKSNGVTGSVIEILPYETQHYNSLQATLNHRFAHGFLWSTNYTRSKQLGTCCDENGDATGGPRIQVPQYTNLNRAILPSDRPNNFNTSIVFQLPFGKGQRFLHEGGIASAVTGGWQLNSIFIHYSGTPFSASGGSALNTPGFTQRAQQVLPNVQYFGKEGPGQLYFDTSAFTPVTAAGVIGNAGYDTLRGPGATKLDMSLFRDFRVRERYSVQFRAEALNISNTPSFNTPQGDSTNAAFGQITSTTNVGRLIDQRYLRFGLKIKF